ncbi:GNAT family N-acetyltransferase [Clostridium sp. CM028]|uniref:GNAT family N-acetyltransferase n=1 Tax=unclassified Clostridium TaxID=2614128 RepID=UPI001C0CEDC4|nr:MULTISPECIES: GNAT family N-acetyltransferase [unclassified Clostridium]MBU3092826.1 GNAT family N-acetyltransferase [Clostridium sp. CF011]MBW9148265.1 GNAT family N-acetyltransferase [Clostridium sp. CM028]WAG70746.1 GNAT family N-acetyltransferase [Clostridium sp. CF011]WLC62375.1 GNAT family N-acetyltransferase [Clostridium sp. CM028]
MKWKIKKFNELNGEEVYEILKLRSEVFVIEQQCIYEECDGKDNNSYHLFAKENGKIIVYLRILEKGISYNEISIGRVLTDKKYRGKGLAKQMMIRAIEFIENNLNEKVIRIGAQEYLVNFYEGLGFVRVSEVYLEDNIPHIEMLYKNL